jgi:hypothetical protein
MDTIVKKLRGSGVYNLNNYQSSNIKIHMQYMTMTILFPPSPPIQAAVQSTIIANKIVCILFDNPLPPQLKASSNYQSQVCNPTQHYQNLIQELTKNEYTTQGLPDKRL